MNIVVTAKNDLELNEPLRTYIRKKIERLGRYFDHCQEADVVLRTRRHRNQGRAATVEVTVFGDGFVLRGEESAEDPYAAIDRVADKLERQLHKVRNRWIHKRRLDEARRQRTQEEQAERALYGWDVPDESPQIVRRKRFATKPMTTEEAQVQMELLDHSFFAYRDAETGRFHVLYRRRDGQLGLIEFE